MKPRIKLAHFNGYRWLCSGEGRFGLGDTPAEAYQRWFVRARAPRKPGW